jgi:hypothetical protein
MDPLLAEVLFTWVAGAAVIGAGVAGILALPWTDSDVLRSASAWRALAAASGTLLAHLRSPLEPVGGAPVADT